jgi:transcriptional antiterminator RfaH
MGKFCAGWYLIYTRPHFERKVRTRLAELEIDSFLPTKRTVKSCRDRIKYVESLLFPSYIFVFLREMRHYYEGMHAEGSLYYVRSGKEIARVSETLINDLKLVTERSEDVEVSCDYYQAGCRLEICKGALAGLSCELVERNKRRTLLVRVDLLRRSILLTLPEDCLIRERI